MKFSRFKNRIPLVVGLCFVVLGVALLFTRRAGATSAASAEAEREMLNAARRIVLGFQEANEDRGVGPADFSDTKRYCPTEEYSFPRVRSWLRSHGAPDSLPWPTHSAFGDIEMTLVRAGGVDAAFAPVFSPSTDKLQFGPSREARLVLRHRDFSRALSASPTIRGQSFPDASAIVFSLETGAPEELPKASSPGGAAK